MPFVVFDKDAHKRGTELFVRFAALNLFFNNACQRALRDASHVIFMVDKSARLVRIKAVKSTEPKAFELHRHSNGTQMSIGMDAFVRTFTPVQRVRLPITEVEGMLQFSMDAPKK